MSIIPSLVECELLKGWNQLFSHSFGLSVSRSVIIPELLFSSKPWARSQVPPHVTRQTLARCL